MATRPISPAALAGLGEPGKLTAAPGSRDWAIAVRLELQGTLHDMKADASHLDAMYRLMLTHKGYEQLTNEQGRPFADFTAFCLARPPYGLGMPPAMIDRLIQDRKTAQARAHQPALLGDHGGDRKTTQLPEVIEGIIENRNTVQGRAHQPALLGDHGAAGANSVDQPVNNRLIQYSSTNADYLTARIARDRPDILDRMKAGEFPSVRAAAMEAGIAKKRVSVPCDPIGAARILSKHFDGDQIRALINALTDADHT